MFDKNNELPKEDYKLFRAGMALRQYHIKWLYGSETYWTLFPNLLKKAGSQYIVGTKELKENMGTIEIDPNRFVENCPDLVRALVFNETDGYLINQFPEQVAEALRSGILKYDGRGYYFVYAEEVISCLD